MTRFKAPPPFLLVFLIPYFLLLIDFLSESPSERRTAVLGLTVRRADGINLLSFEFFVYILLLFFVFFSEPNSASHETQEGHDLFLRSLISFCLFLHLGYFSGAWLHIPNFRSFFLFIFICYSADSSYTRPYFSGSF